MSNDPYVTKLFYLSDIPDILFPLCDKMSPQSGITLKTAGRMVLMLRDKYNIDTTSPKLGKVNIAMFRGFFQRVVKEAGLTKKRERKDFAARTAKLYNKVIEKNSLSYIEYMTPADLYTFMEQVLASKGGTSHQFLHILPESIKTLTSSPRALMILSRVTNQSAFSLHYMLTGKPTKSLNNIYVAARAFHNPARPIMSRLFKHLVPDQYLLVTPSRYKAEVAMFALAIRRANVEETPSYTRLLRSIHKKGKSLNKTPGKALRLANSNAQSWFLGDDPEGLNIWDLNVTNPLYNPDLGVERNAKRIAPFNYTNVLAIR